MKHWRTIYAVEKAKVVAAVWGTELIHWIEKWTLGRMDASEKWMTFQFTSHQTKNGCSSKNFSSNAKWLVRHSSMSPKQQQPTFSSVQIFLLWCGCSHHANAELPAYPLTSHTAWKWREEGWYSSETFFLVC